MNNSKFTTGYPKNSLPKLKPRGIQDLKKHGVEVFDSPCITPLAIFEQKPYYVLIVSLAVGVTKIRGSSITHGHIFISIQLKKCKALHTEQRPRLDHVLRSGNSCTERAIMPSEICGHYRPHIPLNPSQGG